MYAKASLDGSKREVGKSRRQLKSSWFKFHSFGDPFLHRQARTGSLYLSSAKINTERTERAFFPGNAGECNEYFAWKVTNKFIYTVGEP